MKASASVTSMMRAMRSKTLSITRRPLPDHMPNAFARCETDAVLRASLCGMPQIGNAPASRSAANPRAPLAPHGGECGFAVVGRSPPGTADRVGLPARRSRGPLAAGAGVAAANWGKGGGPVLAHAIAL